MALFTQNLSVAAPTRPPVQATAPVRAAGKAPGPFHISLYEPNYILPLSYVTAPDQAVYQGQTPENQRLSHVELQFQISFKVPLWPDIAGQPLTLYAAYTQKSFWQAYVSSAYFRESNYEPALFLSYTWHQSLPRGWMLDSVDLGAMHQSNGRGGTLERSWNRFYLTITASHGPWLVRVQPWYPIPDFTLREHNPDIAHFLGYGRWVVSYRMGRQTFSLLSRNNLTSAFRRGTWQLTWSFPLGHTLHGYVRMFSGYGQSLIEYNHRTQAIGLGISLNDW